MIHGGAAAALGESREEDKPSLRPSFFSLSVIYGNEWSHEWNLMDSRLTGDTSREPGFIHCGRGREELCGSLFTAARRRGLAFRLAATPQK